MFRWMFFFLAAGVGALLANARELSVIMFVMSFLAAVFALSALIGTKKPDPQKMSRAELIEEIEKNREKDK